MLVRMAKRRKSRIPARRAQQPDSRTGAGARRAAHFANGGDPAGWRGRPARHTDRSKAAAKAACRNSSKAAW